MALGGELETWADGISDDSLYEGFNSCIEELGHVSDHLVNHVGRVLERRMGFIEGVHRGSQASSLSVRSRRQSGRHGAGAKPSRSCSRSWGARGVVS